MALGTRQSSVTELFAAAWALQLLQYAVFPVSADTVPGRTMSQDYLTLRYHGRDSSRFNTENNYPTEICSTSPATCMDLRLWECADSPLDMRVPYGTEAHLGMLASEKINNLPQENAGGSRLLLARSAISPQTPMDSDPQLVLWSGCNASCADCAAGTGKLLILHQLPRCVATAPGGIFGILYNDNSGMRDTRANCYASLEVYDQEAERQNRMRQIVKYCAFGSVGMVGLFLATLLICYRCHRKRRQEERRRSNAGGAATPSATAIGKASIEEHFPVSHSNEGNQCVVCLLDIQEGEDCRKLQCGHEFHADCIVGWWTHVPRASLECPLCKRKQRLGDEDPEEAREAPAASNNNVAQGSLEAGTAASEAPAPAPVASGTAADHTERGRNRPVEVVDEI